MKFILFLIEFVRSRQCLFYLKNTVVGRRTNSSACKTYGIENEKTRQFIKSDLFQFIRLYYDSHNEPIYNQKYNSKTIQKCFQGWRPSCSSVTRVLTKETPKMIYNCNRKKNEMQFLNRSTQVKSFRERTKKRNNRNKDVHRRIEMNKLAEKEKMCAQRHTPSNQIIKNWKHEKN